MSLDLSHPIKHHLFRLRYTELNEIYYFMALRSFALSMITIFIPIYMYNAGYGISNIFLYYLSLYFMEFLFEYLAANYLKVRGPKHAMIISLPFMIVHLWQLFSLQTYGWSPFILAITSSVSLAFFWEGYHYDFSRSKHTARATKEVGKIFIVLTVIGSAAPLIGGVLSSVIGVNNLLLIVIAILFGGTVILLKTKDKNFRKGKINLRAVNIRHIKNHILSYAGLGWETVSAMQIWPLFLFLMLKSYSKIGIITSLTLLVTIAVTYWVSRRADKGKRTDYIKTGSIINSIVGIIQVFIETIAQAFAINVARSFAHSLYKSPFDSEYYLHADEESRSEYIYIMESAVDLSRMLFYLILYLLSFYLPLYTLLVIGLLMGAAGALLLPLMPPAQCEICGPMKNRTIKLMPRPKGAK